MSKNKPELSARTAGALQDLNALVGRYNAYTQAIDNGLSLGTFKDAEITSRYHDSCLSVIDGLGTQEFRNHLTSEQKVTLVNAINSSSLEVVKLAENQVDKDKLTLIAAKIEASLKGFELPLSLGGPSDELELYALEQDHYAQIIDITKKSLLELAGQDVQPEAYAEQIKILINQKAKDIFPEGQLEDVRKIIEQGSKPSKQNRFESSELPVLAQTAVQSSNNLIEILEQNKQKAISQDIIISVIASIEASGTKVGPKQTKILIKELTPMLNKSLSDLDPDYVQNNKGIIIAEIEKSIVSKSMTTSNRLGGLYIREAKIAEVLVNLNDNHIDRSDQYRINKIEQGLSTSPDSVIEAKLSELNIERAANVKHDINKISDQDLVTMRKENPQQFDDIVLNRKNTVSDSQTIVNEVINEAIQKLEAHNGVKVDKDKIQKFKEQLSPALSKLDPEYLKAQSDIISSSLQKDMYKNKSMGSFIGRPFSVTTNNLSAISNKLTNQHKEASHKFETNMVKSSISKLSETNAQLEERLSKLEVTKAREVKYKASAVSSEDLLKMRKENPARFDKIILGVKQAQGKTSSNKDFAKQNIIDKAKGIGNVIAKSPSKALTPPPSLVAPAKTKANTASKGGGAAEIIFNTALLKIRNLFNII